MSRPLLALAVTFFVFPSVVSAEPSKKEAKVRQTMHKALSSLPVTALIFALCLQAVSADPSNSNDTSSSKMSITARKEPDIGASEALLRHIVRLHIATVLAQATTPTALRSDATLTFSLDTSGKASMIRMTKSTGSQSTDGKLVESLRLARFPQLPPECSPKEFTFPLRATLEKSTPLVQQQLRKAGIEIRTVLGKFDKK